MATITEIQDLNQFMLSLPPGEREGLCIDAIYERWREQTLRSEDLAAIQASLQDYDNGERGRPLGDFLAEFDGERNANGSVARLPALPVRRQWARSGGNFSAASAGMGM